MVCIHLTNPFVNKIWWRKNKYRHIKWIKTMAVCRIKKSICIAVGREKTTDRRHTILHSYSVTSIDCSLKKTAHDMLHFIEIKSIDCTQCTCIRNAYNILYLWYLSDVSEKEYLGISIRKKWANENTHKLLWWNFIELAQLSSAQLVRAFFFHHVEAIKAKMAFTI